MSIEQIPLYHPLQISKKSDITVFRHGLIALDTAIWLSILGQAIVLSWLVVTAGAATTGLATGTAACLSTLLSGLMGVDFAVGELAGSNTLVGLSVLAETVVLWWVRVSNRVHRTGKGKWGKYVNKDGRDWEVMEGGCINDLIGQNVKRQSRNRLEAPKMKLMERRWASCKVHGPRSGMGGDAGEMT